MKKTLILLALIAPFMAHAQSLEGVLHYTETIQLKIELDGADAEMMKNFPKSQSNPKELLFNEKESLYRDTPESAGKGDEDIETSSDGMHMQMKIQRPENILYKNLDDNQETESTEFFGRFFLIQGDPTAMKWKISGDKKEIAGYTCQKAVLQDTSKNVVVWFSPQIPLPIGPGQYSSLPGAVLEMSMDNGDRTIVCNKVELKKLEAKAIEKPTKGKKVSREEFNKIRDEKMKEMGAENGGGGTMRVIIRN